jgi:hypothetical protein
VVFGKEAAGVTVMIPSLSIAEQEAEAYLSTAFRAHARPRVRITDGRVFINGAELSPAGIYAERIRLQRLMPIRARRHFDS